MSYTLEVNPFAMGTSKDRALKPLEEAAEAFGAWQLYNYAISGESYERFADEIADCIQACCNLADTYNVDLQAAMERCEKRNRDRGRYKS